MFNNYFVNEVKDDTCNLHDSSKLIYENQMYKDQNQVSSEFKFRFIDSGYGKSNKLNENREIFWI